MSATIWVLVPCRACTGIGCAGCAGIGRAAVALPDDSATGRALLRVLAPVATIPLRVAIEGLDAELQDRQRPH